MHCFDTLTYNYSRQGQQANILMVTCCFAVKVGDLSGSDEDVGVVAKQEMHLHHNRTFSFEQYLVSFDICGGVDTHCEILPLVSYCDHVHQLVLKTKKWIPLLMNKTEARQIFEDILVMIPPCLYTTHKLQTVSLPPERYNYIQRIPETHALDCNKSDCNRPVFLCLLNFPTAKHVQIDDEELDALSSMT
eukprot:764137-Hanusia_phi.AAC.2